MALVVETGSGLPDADAYVSVDDMKKYCDDRGLSYGGASDAVLEQKIRLATDFIDTVNRYKGIKLSASQSLEFPRSSLSDASGLIVAGLPRRVVMACCELALKGLTTELSPDLARGGRVKSESVGPISTTYADDAPAGTVFTAAMRLLDPFVRTAAAAPGSPRYTATEPGFTVSDDSYPASYLEGA